MYSITFKLFRKQIRNDWIPNAADSFSVLCISEIFLNVSPNHWYISFIILNNEFIEIQRFNEYRKTEFTTHFSLKCFV